MKNSNEVYSFKTQSQAQVEMNYMTEAQHKQCKLIKDNFNYTVITINPKAQKIINAHLGKKSKK